MRARCKTRFFPLAILCGGLVAVLSMVLDPGMVLGHGKGHRIGADEHPAIKARHMLMDNAGFAAKTAGQMVKGAAPYDPLKAGLALRMIQTTAHTMANYFPEASKPAAGSKSEAAPKIWSDMAGFLAEVEKFKAASTAAVKPAGQGLEAFRGAFLQVVKSCKSCHESYRIKKE